ncbi:MAG TPA: hypothetical protein VII90_02660, partial [Anaerolineales bacterium]
TGSMACSTIPFLAPTATPTVTLTPTLTPTMTSTATPTSTPTSTRTLTPTKITGIEEPVLIGDAKLQFRKALRRDRFLCGDQSYPVETPDTDEFLILTAKVIGGPVVKTPADMTDWVSANEFDLMEVVDDNSHYSAYDSICYSMDSKDVVIQVVLPFVINKDAVTFVLILPDDTHIPLDPIL